MNGSGSARSLIDSWPNHGLVVGVLPDLSDPEWSGRAVLELTAAAAEDRRPVLVLDLAPETSDLSSRFDAEGEPGFAEVAAGRVEIWQIIHRDDERGAFFLPCGLRTSGAELAGTRSVRALAERVRPRGGVLLVLLDRHGAGSAASGGWVDGFVRLGEKHPGEPRLPGDVPELGRLEPSPDSGEREPERIDPAQVVSEALWLRPPGDLSESTEGDGERTDGGPNGPPGETEKDERRRLELSRRRNPTRPWLRRAGRGLVLAAVLAGLGFGGFMMLGEPGSSAVEEVGATSAGEAAARASPSAPPSLASSAVFSDSAPGRALASRSRGTIPDSAPGPSGGGGDRDTEASPPPESAGTEAPAPAPSADDAASEEPAAGEEPPPSSPEPTPGSDGGARRSTPRVGPLPDPGSLESAAARRFYAVADSVVRSVRRYYRQEARFRTGRVGCFQLESARDAADRLFLRLSLRLRTIPGPPDSTARSTYRQLGREIEDLDRSFGQIDCSGPGPGTG